MSKIDAGYFDKQSTQQSSDQRQERQHILTIYEETELRKVFLGDINGSDVIKTYFLFK